MKKKVMALALSAVMALSTVPWEASAAEPRPDPGEEIVVVEDTGEVSDTAEAEEEPGAVEMPEAEAPADDVILDDGLEIAEIAEVGEEEVPEEAVENLAVEPEEVLELGQEDTGIAALEVEGDPDKTDETAYKGNTIGTVSVPSRLTVKFKDRADENPDEKPVITAGDVTAGPTSTYGHEYYWIDKSWNPIDKDDDPEDEDTSGKLWAVYDPTYNPADLEPNIDGLPELKITWDEYDAAGQKVVEEGEPVKTTLQYGTDYTYRRIDSYGANESEANKFYNAAGDAEHYAVIEVDFIGRYSRITSLRMKYWIEQKDISRKVDGKLQVTIDGTYNEDDKAYHFTYDGEPHRPTVTSVTYKGVELKDPVDRTIVEPAQTRANKHADVKAAAAANKNIACEKDGGEYTGYYQMTVKGNGNYKGERVYRYVIEQKELKEEDIDKFSLLEKETFFVDLDEDKIKERIDEKLKGYFENKTGDKLAATEGEAGYVIYYYKIIDGHEELFATINKKCADIVGADNYGTTAPATSFRDVYKLPDPADPNYEAEVKKRIAAIKNLEGEYTYHIQFTGKGNFVEKERDKNPVIKGNFFIVGEAPKLADVYNSVKDEVVKAIKDLNLVYDATDWLVRNGGSVDEPNDVTEAVKKVFGTYTYKVREGAKLVDRNAGDNIEISLKPGQSENGKMIDADKDRDGEFVAAKDGYIIRIKGTNDWTDQYVDMDKSDELTVVNPRQLEGSGGYVDDAGSGSGGVFKDIKDSAGHITTHKTDMFKDKFFIGRDGVAAYVVDENKDIYKYGAVQYRNGYTEKTYTGYDKAEVTITHLVRSTGDTETYPEAKDTDDGDINLDTNMPSGSSELKVPAREKKLEYNKDYTVGTTVNTHSGIATKWETPITGIGNYTGTVYVPTFRKDQVDLSNKRFEIRIKSTEAPDGYYNTDKYVVQKEGDPNALTLVYQNSYGIDVKPENIEIVCTGDNGEKEIVKPDDYEVVIDENGICKRCKDIAGVGEGKHVHVGKHSVLVRGKDTACEGSRFQEIEFYIAGDNFSEVYEAIWDEEKAGSLADFEENLKVGQVLKTGKAPHSNVKVVSKAGGNVVLNYAAEYQYDCYYYLSDSVKKEKNLLDKEGNLDPDRLYANLDLKDLTDDKCRMNVKEGVEFEYAGDWILVITPMNTTDTKVEQFEGCLYFPFKVAPKDFAEPAVKVTVDPKGLDWPGQAVTGAEIADKLVVEDTEKLMDTELVYGTDYTIDKITEEIADSGDITLNFVLKGMGNYDSDDAINETIKVNKVDLTEANAKVKLDEDTLAYKGSEFTADDKEAVRPENVTVTVTVNGREFQLNPEEFTVTAATTDPKAENPSAVGTDVTVTVEGQKHYTGSVKAYGKIVKANLSNTANFTVEKIVSPKVYEGEDVKQDAARLVIRDNRTKETVEFDAEGIHYDYAEGVIGEATIYLPPMDTEAYDGEAVGTFEIIAKAGGIVLNAESFEYTKAGLTSKDVIKEVYGKDGKLQEEDDYTVEFGGSYPNAGPATVVVTIKTAEGEEYSLPENFTITPIELTEENVALAETAYTYTGSKITPAVTVTVNEEALTEGTDYSVVPAEDVNAGEVTAAVKGTGNYAGEVPVTFTIAPADISGDRFELRGVKDVVYHDDEAAVQTGLTLFDTVTRKEVTVEEAYAYERPETTGTAEVTVTAADPNYTGTHTAEFTITEQIPERLELTGKSFTYTGEPVEDVVAAVYAEDGSVINESKWKAEYENNTDAGLATVTVTVTMESGEKQLTDTFEITPVDIADAEISGVEETYEFTGSKITPEVTVTMDGEPLVKDQDYVVIYTDEVNVGGMAVTVKGTGNYTGSAAKEYTVTAADISNADRFQLDGVADKIYVEGTPAEQTGLKLTDNRTGAEIAVKEVRYENNDKPGTATVTVTPDDANYTGEKKAAFAIVQPGLRNVELKSETFPYTGKAYTAEDVIAAVYRNDGTKTEKYTAVFKEDDVTNVGTKTLVVTIETTEEKKSEEKTFTILPVQIADSGVTGVAESYVYDGTVKRPVVTVAAGGKKLVQNEDYVVYNTESAEVGTKELAVQGIGNYAGNVLKKFTVTPATIEGAGVTGVKAGYKYNGTVRVPNVKVTAGGRVLRKDADYVVKATESAEIGAKQLVIEGTGNYTGSLAQSFTVAPAKAVVADVSAAKAKKLTVTAEEQSGASYQIQYRVQGKNGWTSVKSANAEKVLKGLKSGKKYEIRVRAYAEINGERVNGKWSKVTVSKKVK